MLVGSMQLGIDPHYILTDQQVIVHMLVLVPVLFIWHSPVLANYYHIQIQMVVQTSSLLVHLFLSLYNIYIYIYCCRLVEQFWLISFIVTPIVLQLR